MTTDNSQKFKRSLRNLRFIKDTKLRFVFACMTLGMIISSVSLVNVLYVVGRALQNAPTPDPSLRAFLDQIGETVSRALIVGLILSICSAAIAVLFGLMVSHRFKGPVVPLARHLKELRDGLYGNRVALRPGDELFELQDAQNALAEELERKHGAKRA